MSRVKQLKVLRFPFVLQRIECINKRTSSSFSFLSLLDLRNVFVGIEEKSGKLIVVKKSDYYFFINFMGKRFKIDGNYLIGDPITRLKKKYSFRKRF